MGNRITGQWPLIAFDDALQYLGLVCILGVCPCPSELVDGRIIQMADGSSRLYAMPFGDPGCGVVVEDAALSAATWV